MKIYSLSVIILVTLLVGCQKKDTAVIPAKGPNANTPHISDAVAPAPYTDTFSGTVLQPNSFGVSTPCFVYAHYPLDGNVFFSSTFNQDIPDAYEGSIAAIFYINDSNVYSYDSYDHHNSYRFKVTHDTLFFTASQFRCPDIFAIDFKGKKISKNH